MEAGIQNQAFREYQESKDRARFVSLAQKLAQHLNNLAEDKNSRIRWIWELIQNAKDVPNQFGKCKIRVELWSDRLVFAHNGDPFRVADLESLAAQYSSKPEQNKTHTQTTGKYGTGFITTYILSRKVRINGLLEMTSRKEFKKGLEEKEGQETQEVKDTKEVKEEEKDLYKGNNEVSKEKKEEEKGQNYYQRFQVFLDRSYSDRDTQLTNKLMRTQHNLMQDLLKNEPKPKWQRKQDEYNTKFAYEGIDNPAHDMIQQAIKALKELFPYALLFNPKLYELHFVNKLEGKKTNKSFMIKRMEETHSHGMQIFNALISEEGKDDRKFSAVYLDDEETHSTVAVPVELKGGALNLLQANGTYPKMFKEFPLIGCSDHGFNFVFTSRRFYPNETRSDLLLNQIEGRFSPKAKANWDALEGIFEKGLILYKKLSEEIAQGQQNLLKVVLSNQFTSQKFESNLIYRVLMQYQEELSKLKFIEFANGKRGSLNELVFPCGESENRKADALKYSVLLNSKFKDVFGLNRVLSQKNYKKIYPKLLEYWQTWKMSDVQMKNVRQCLLELSKYSYTRLITKVGNEDDAFNMLDGVYKFLSKYNPGYTTQTRDMNEQFDQKLNYILTNKEEFKNLKSMIHGHPLMIKEELPEVYEEIAGQIGIDIDDYTINDDFVEYFTGVKSFGIEEMLSLYKSIFYVKWKEIQGVFDCQEKFADNKFKIVLLGRFLTTFKIESKGFELIGKFNHFDNVETPFKIKDSKSELKLREVMVKEYRYLFEIKVMRYINDVFNRTGNSLESAMKLTKLENKKEFFGWLNKVYILEKKLLSNLHAQQFKNVIQFCYPEWRIQNMQRDYLIDRNLNLSENFVERNTLSCFTEKIDDKLYKGNYPNEEDLKIHYKMKEIERKGSLNYAHNPIDNIKKRILHQQVNDSRIIGTTFQKEFQFINHLYVSKRNLVQCLNGNEKIVVLNYVYRVRQNAEKDKKLEFKIEVFRPIEKRAYYDYPYMTTCLTEEKHQVQVFHLFKHPEEISASVELRKKYGSLEKALEMLSEKKKDEESQK